MTNVFLLPASCYQKKLYYFLKKKGYNVFTINPVDNEITLDNKKNHLQCDIFETNKIVSFLKKNSVEYGFTDQSDIAVIPFTKISNELGIKSNSLESIMRFSCDKINMYNFAESCGIKHLGSNLLLSFEQIKEELPVVIKPADSANSRGVHKIESKKDFDKFYKESISFSKSKRVLYQKFNPGTMQIIVEGICINKKHINLTSCFKGPYWETAITSYCRYPLKDLINNSLLKKIYDTNTNFVESTGLDFGLTHGEYILDGKNIFLNEIGCRGGGFKITSDIVPHVCGIDPYDFLHDCIVKESSKLPEIKEEKSAILKFYTKDRQTSKENIEKIAHMPNVIEFQQNFVKSEYKKNKDNPRYSFLIAKGSDYLDLNHTIEKVENHLIGEEYESFQ